MKLWLHLQTWVYDKHDIALSDLNDVNDQKICFHVSPRLYYINMLGQLFISDICLGSIYLVLRGGGE